VRDMQSNTLGAVRASLIDKCVDVLAAYRKHCASTTSPGQLILPESLKLLPIYVLSLSKHPLLRASAEASVDERAYNMAVFNDDSPALTTPFVYPRLYPLHKLPADVGVEDSGGRVVIPTPQRLTAEYLEADGAYLLENGKDMYLWLGRSAPGSAGELFHEVLAVTADRNAPRTHPDTDRVVHIIDAIRAQRCKGAVLRLVRARDPLEGKLLASLVEDRAGEAASYVDFLVQVHKLIQGRLA
jgi:protein transport protein SEC24